MRRDYAGVDPTPLFGLGQQLRNLANDPASGVFVSGGVVRPLPEMSEMPTEEPPIFAAVQQEITCAVTGMAQVIKVYFPHHRRVD